MSDRETYTALKLGDVLKNQYQVKTQLGINEFAAVFEVFDNKRNGIFACKVSQFHF